MYAIFTVMVALKGGKNMLTPFGRELRVFRMDNGELLKEMATNLGVTPAYLSAVENGKKEPTDELMNRIYKAYQLNEDQITAFEDAKAKTLRVVRINFSQDEDEEVGLLFARKLSSLSEHQREAILKILRTDNCD